MFEPTSLYRHIHTGQVVTGAALNDYAALSGLGIFGLKKLFHKITKPVKNVWHAVTKTKTGRILGTAALAAGATYGGFKLGQAGGLIPKGSFGSFLKLAPGIVSHQAGKVLTGAAHVAGSVVRGGSHVAGSVAGAFFGHGSAAPGPVAPAPTAATGRSLVDVLAPAVVGAVMGPAVTAPPQLPPPSVMGRNVFSPTPTGSPTFDPSMFVATTMPIRQPSTPRVALPAAGSAPSAPPVVSTSSSSPSSSMPLLLAAGAALLLAQ